MIDRFYSELPGCAVNFSLLEPVRGCLLWLWGHPSLSLQALSRVSQSEAAQRPQKSPSIKLLTRKFLALLKFCLQFIIQLNSSFDLPASLVKLLSLWQKSPTRESVRFILTRYESIVPFCTCRRRSCSFCHFSCLLRSSSGSQDQRLTDGMIDGTGIYRQRALISNVHMIPIWQPIKLNWTELLKMWHLFVSKHLLFAPDNAYKLPYACFYFGGVNVIFQSSYFALSKDKLTFLDCIIIYKFRNPVASY